MIEEQREAIKAGEKPKYTFSEFIETYKEYTNNLAIGEKTDRAISLAENKIELRKKDGVKVWHIMQKAGKQGKPLTVIKKTGEKHSYDSDSAAVYEFHVFIYENSEDFIAIFHRQNGSGCKSVFFGRFHFNYEILDWDKATEHLPPVDMEAFMKALADPNLGK